MIRISPIQELQSPLLQENQRQVTECERIACADISAQQARKASKTFQRLANGNSYRLERRDSLEFSKRTLDDDNIDGVDVADRPSAKAFSPA